jgi:arylsulfatase A-like enzyme
MEYLKQQEIEEQTIVIYVTDNGWIQDPDRPNRYGPRSKRTPYDMGIRTPIILNWKGTIKPVMDEESLVSSIDIASTILEITGIPVPEDRQGLNLLNSRSLAERTTIFAENYAHDFSSMDSSLFQRIILSGNWKLIEPDKINRPGSFPELFNLNDDPGEEHNLYQEYPAIANELKQELELWWEETN